MRTLRFSRLRLMVGLGALVASLSLVGPAPVDAHENHVRSRCSARWSKPECSFIYQGGDVQLGAWSTIAPDEVVEPGIVRLEVLGPGGVRQVILSCATVRGGCAAATAGDDLAAKGTKMFCSFTGEGSGGRYWCRATPD